MPSSSQSHTHAPPTDDFGDFQQGQQAFQPPSLLPPPPPPSSRSLVTPAKEPVDLIKVSNSSTAQPQGKPPTGGDKYSIFDDLRLISSSDEAMSGPLLDVMKKSSEISPQLPLATTTAAPSTAVPPLPSDGGFADFASFQQAPSTAASGRIGPSAPAAPEVDSSANQGWAAFGDFTSSQVTSSHSVPPPSLPSTSTVILPAAPPSSDAASIKSKASSAFDSLLPPELLPSNKALPKSVNPEPKSVDATLLGSFESKPPSVTNSGTSTVSAGLDFGVFESDISPESSKKKAQKQMTGLEILEEEFSARVSAKATASSSLPPPLNIEEPLVPESAAPLDDFGEFEGYSSPPGGKEKATTGFPPLAGISAGEPSPSLKKKVSNYFNYLPVIII